MDLKKRVGQINFKTQWQAEFLKMAGMDSHGGFWASPRGGEGAEVSHGVPVVDVRWNDQGDRRFL